MDLLFNRGDQLGGLGTLEFRVLGAVEATSGGRGVHLGHARQRCVLAVLLVDANRPVSVDQIMDRVWEGRFPQHGRDALHGYLSRLRKILGTFSDVTILRRGGGYVLTVDEASVDLHRFRLLSRRAREADGDALALALFDEARALWRDIAFADVDTSWFAMVRTALDAERHAVDLDRTDAALRCGQHAELVAELTNRAAQHPLDERVASRLLVALYRTGRQADALHHYHYIRNRLAEELGADPSPFLQLRYRQILAADPDLALPVYRSIRV